MLEGDKAKLAAAVSALVHEKKFRVAAQLVSDACKLDQKIASERQQDWLPTLQLYLHWLLNNNGMEEAAQLLWTPTQFSPLPQSTRDVWKLFDRAAMGLVMGAASMSKSYGFGVRSFLEWIRDPEWTTVRVVGPSEDHLESNLFSQLVSLHDQASLPMPGTVGSLYIGLNRRNLISSIKGLVIPVGKVKKAGRIQGTKRKPRPKPHPVFGPLSRMIIFLDEIENVPEGVWSDIDNALSMVDGVSNAGLKIFGAYNPTNQTDEVGVRAEPPFGWPEFDLDKHFNWISKRGWEVLRLDGERSENVVQGRTIFPGLQTREGLETIAKNAGGVQSGGYLTMGRGAYPSQTLEMTVIPPGMLNKARGEFIWLEVPQSCGSADLALEGGATAVFTVGKVGLATGIKWAPTIEHPAGRTEMFKDESGQVKPRWAVQVDQQFPLPKGDTVAMAASVTDMAKKAGIKPELLCVDRTGNGAGVHDLILNDWSSSVHGVNYSSSPTDRRILEEDSKVANEEFDRIDSELWFALRAWIDFRVVLIHPQVDLKKITPQITQRRFRVIAGKRKVESKKDFKARGNESPDEADSLTLLIHAVRLGKMITPSMKGSGNSSAGEDEDWWGEDMVTIDPSNMTDTLQV
jgi:hypothetical protein